jgi:hypothetical protein
VSSVKASTEVGFLSEIVFFPDFGFRLLGFLHSTASVDPSLCSNASHLAACATLLSSHSSACSGVVGAEC